MKRITALALVLLLLLAAGCAANTPPETPAPTQAPTAPPEPTAEPAPTAEPEPEPTVEPAPEPAAEPDYSDRVASADQMTTVEDVVEEGMVPISGEALVDGEYDIQVDCSSSMFRITECLLTVEDGKMTALMTMGGTAYPYVRLGTALEAAAAEGTAEENYISYVENAEGAHTFTIPVEALDAGIALAAYSKNKEIWYDRTILFRADSLPMDAFKEGVFHTAETLGLADGSYTVEVSLSGGSGRAKVVSPAPLTVEGGVCTAYVEWGSPNYDYMLVGGEKLLTVNSEGNSAFLVPVALFDRPLAVTADTTAMSQAHEIEYTLFFDSSTLLPAE
jgi:hypothetical protein